MSKRQTAITRAARHAWRSRPDRSIANCAARRLSMVSTLKTLFTWLKIHDFYDFSSKPDHSYDFSTKKRNFDELFATPSSFRGLVHACMHACMHALMNACTDACMNACMHSCIHACTHSCRHECVHAFIHSSPLIPTNRQKSTETAIHSTSKNLHVSTSLATELLAETKYRIARPQEYRLPKVASQANNISRE